MWLSQTHHSDTIHVIKISGYIFMICISSVFTYNDLKNPYFCFFDPFFWIYWRSSISKCMHIYASTRIGESRDNRADVLIHVRDATLRHRCNTTHERLPEAWRVLLLRAGADAQSVDRQNPAMDPPVLDGGRRAGNLLEARRADRLQKARRRHDAEPVRGLERSQARPL